VTGEISEELKGRSARRDRSARSRARAEQACRDEERARQPWGVTVGGVDLTHVTLDEVRSRILVSDTSPQVFAGTLREAIDPHGRLTRAEAERALYTAAADDVFDALPGGWQGHLDERGRGLSGGQRQRLVLMRALAADPEVLVLVEPTSAVDAHTEARIAERMGSHREGRTTVVMTASPLLLHHADDVILLDGGKVTARGRHADLLAGSAAYRSVVVRGEAHSEPPHDGSATDGGSAHASSAHASSALDGSDTHCSPATHSIPEDPHGPGDLHEPPTTYEEGGVR
jgi:ABC-type multidrug transport system ATPase subunit